MRNTWLLVLAACGGGTEPRDGVRGSGSSAPGALSAPRPPLTEPVGAPVTGMPGAPTARIAVTDAGDAAVPADTTGAIRLWPALDGTREPVVVSGSQDAAYRRRMIAYLATREYIAPTAQGCALWSRGAVSNARLGG